jgi:hypothetical protein
LCGTDLRPQAFYWPQSVILQISASSVARITDMSHHIWHKELLIFISITFILATYIVRNLIIIKFYGRPMSPWEDIFILSGCKFLYVFLPPLICFKGWVCHVLHPPSWSHTNPNGFTSPMNVSPSLHFGFFKVFVTLFWYIDIDSCFILWIETFSIKRISFTTFNASYLKFTLFNFFIAFAYYHFQKSADYSCLLFSLSELF